MCRVGIIGNGITGITAARYLRKRTQDEIFVISDETPHFFSRPALMYIYMGHMQFRDTKPYEDRFWEKNRIGLIHDHVDRVDPSARELHLRKGQTVSYDKLVIASGSKSNKFGWPGQDLEGVQGLHSYPDVLNMERMTESPIERAVIVGGGLIGIEMAEMLLARNVAVTFLIREENFWNIVLPKEEAVLVNEFFETSEANEHADPLPHGRGGTVPAPAHFRHHPAGKAIRAAHNGYDQRDPDRRTKSPGDP